MLIVLFCIPAIGCHLEKHSINAPDADSMGTNKTFSGDGYSLVLTDRFEEKNSSVGFDGYYVSSFCGVMVQKVPFTDEWAQGMNSTRDFLEGYINDENENSSIMEEDDLTYYRYYNNGRAYWNFGFKGENDFYSVQFVCDKRNEESLNDSVFAFAKSVNVN